MGTNENLQKARRIQKAYYDKAAKESQVQVNDTVLLKKFTHKPGSLQKFSDYWEGEYKVLKLPDSHHALILKPGQPDESARKVHLDQIKPLRIAVPKETVIPEQIATAYQAPNVPEMSQEKVNNKQIDEIPTSSKQQFENTIETPQIETTYQPMHYINPNNQNYYPADQQNGYNDQNYHPTDQDYYNQYEPRLSDEQMSRQAMTTPHNNYYGRHVRQMPPYEHQPKLSRRKSRWQEEQDRIYRSHTTRSGRTTKPITRFTSYHLEDEERRYRDNHRRRRRPMEIEYDERNGRRIWTVNV